jgi:geranyl-CoA carboxylase alpha subunit
MERLKTILIANRGEIAVRVIKTARRLGYRTVAVCSDSDRDALHVKLADQAVQIGGHTPQESYLSQTKIIEACKRSGADAVHPGYGFLSENSQFAQACSDNGLTLIGPSAQAIEAMGNKSRSKDLMLKAGVPCIPGYQGAIQDLDYLLARAMEIGFPLMVKASAGGGGRGLRLAWNESELAELLESARLEAERSFGSGELLLERALINARHVEIQIFGDRHGNVIHLGERDCSIQRRHQKVFEESPSPAVDQSLRNRMGEAAVRAARAIDYAGAGTVEFLLDQDGQFYFLEMNTRLQVEHPVTEMITGLDLVEWQLNVAAGLPLPLSQDQLRFDGHSIEARLYAENPDDNFQPQSGTVVHWRPANEELARTDHCLQTGDRISPYYDSLLAKIIAHGPDRETARRRLEQALADTEILGVKTNRELLLSCVGHCQFINNQTDTGFLSRIWPAQTELSLKPDANALTIAALLTFDCNSSDELSGWSSSGRMQSPLRLSINDLLTVDVQIEFLPGKLWRVHLLGQTKTVSLLELKEPSAKFLIDGMLSKATFVRQGTELFLATDKVSYAICDVLHKPRKQLETQVSGDVLAPTNGLIGSFFVRAGQFINSGEPVCTVEAMKLLQTVSAPVSGYITAVLAGAGQQVKSRQLLLQIESAAAAPSASEAVSGKDVQLVEV